MVKCLISRIKAKWPCSFIKPQMDVTFSIYNIYIKDIYCVGTRCCAKLERKKIIPQLSI